MENFYQVYWFGVDEPIRVELRKYTKDGISKIIIETTYDQVDKWDYDRIETEINNLITKD